MYRFLLSRRWVGFAVFVLVLAAVCAWLGNWQFQRLDSRKDHNALVEKHFKVAPVSLATFTNVDKPLPAGDEWTRISARGSYDVAHQYIVKYQTREEGPGVNVVTPLVMADGNAILVDRGWFKTAANAAAVTNVPPPPSGTVDISGWMRVNNGADKDAVTPHDGEVRAISSEGAARVVPYDLYDGYVNLRKQAPQSQTPLAPEPMPDMGQGPHFFYALQWLFFGLLAVFGWFYFARVEAKETSERETRGDVPSGVTRG